MTYELVHTLKHDSNSDNDENTVLATSEDVDILKDEGKKFAKSKGVEGIAWASFFTDKPWKYTFKYSDTESLTITDISR